MCRLAEEQSGQKRIGWEGVRFLEGDDKKTGKTKPAEAASYAAGIEMKGPRRPVAANFTFHG